MKMTDKKWDFKYFKLGGGSNTITAAFANQVNFAPYHMTFWKGLVVPGSIVENAIHAELIQFHEK